MADSVDQDQTPHSAASDLGLHCLHRPVSPNTWSKYDNMIKSTPHKYPPGSASVKTEQMQKQGTEQDGNKITTKPEATK